MVKVILGPAVLLHLVIYCTAAAVVLSFPSARNLLNALDHFDNAGSSHHLHDGLMHPQRRDLFHRAHIDNYGPPRRRSSAGFPAIDLLDVRHDDKGSPGFASVRRLLSARHGRLLEIDAA